MVHLKQILPKDEFERFSRDKKFKEICEFIVQGSKNRRNKSFRFQDEFLSDNCNYIKNKGMSESEISYTDLNHCATMVEFMNFMTLVLSDTAPSLPCNLLPEKVVVRKDVISLTKKSTSEGDLAPAKQISLSSSISSFGAVSTDKLFLARSMEYNTCHLLEEEAEISKYRDGYSTEVLISLARLYYAEQSEISVNISRFKAHTATNSDRSFSFLDQLLR